MFHRKAGTARGGPVFSQEGRGGARRARPVRHELDWEQIGRIHGRVTALEPQQRDPDRRSLFVDDRFVMGLHQEIVFLAGLRVGQIVDGERLVALLQQELEKRCWDEALRFLARAAHARREVERKLARRWAPELVERVINRLERGGWLDDRAFVRSYVQAKHGYGTRRILAELTRKGVDRALAESVLAEMADELRQELADADQPSGMGETGALGGAAVIRSLAEKRLSAVRGLDRVAAERRLGGYLIRRGFDLDEVREVLRELLHDFPPPAPKPRKGWGRAAREEDLA
jgi:regulatory protein